MNNNFYKKSSTIAIAVSLPDDLAAVYRPTDRKQRNAIQKAISQALSEDLQVSKNNGIEDPVICRHCDDKQKCRKAFIDNVEFECLNGVK